MKLLVRYNMTYECEVEISPDQLQLIENGADMGSVLIIDVPKGGKNKSVPVPHSFDIISVSTEEDRWIHNT